VRVVHDTVGGRPIVVFFEKGTASALDSPDIASGRDIGATGVFSHPGGPPPELSAGGQRLYRPRDPLHLDDHRGRYRRAAAGEAAHPGCTRESLLVFVGRLQAEDPDLQTVARRARRV